MHTGMFHLLAFQVIKIINPLTYIACVATSTNAGQKFFFFLSQQFITQGMMAVCAYRRNYVWSINTLTFFMQLPNTKDY